MTSPRPSVDQPRQKSNGPQVLVWMRDEFEALRRQVHALATSVAQQRSLLADLTDGRVSEMNVSLVELESCAAALKHEASKLQGLEKAMAERLTGIVADAVRPQLRAAVAARLPGLVSETVQPELRAALDEMRECADDLKNEASLLRTMRDDMATQIPDLVQAAVERALSSQSSSSSSPPTGGSPLASPSAVAPGIGSVPAIGATLPESSAPSASGSDSDVDSASRPAAAAGGGDAPGGSGAFASPTASASSASASPASSSPGGSERVASQPAPAVAGADGRGVEAAPTAGSSTSSRSTSSSGTSSGTSPRSAGSTAGTDAGGGGTSAKPVPGSGALQTLVGSAATAPSLPSAAGTREAVVERISSRSADAPPADGSPGAGQTDTVDLGLPAAESSAGAASVGNGSASAHTVTEVAEDDVTCVMPGMVVGPSLAAGITSALGRARLRRRRRRRAAAPAPGLHRRDPFAGHVTRRLERFTRGRASTPGVRSASPEGRMGEGAWAVVAAGARDAQEVTVDLARANGLVLSGAGAANMARALVTTLLASRAHTDAAVVVVGDLLPAVPPFPGVAQAAELGPVIDELTSEVTRRSKMLADEGVPDAGAYRSRHPEAALPLLVLATGEPSAEDAVRLNGLLNEGARVGVNAVFACGPGAQAGMAALSGATRLTIDGDGRVGGDIEGSALASIDGAVAFSLDTQTAAELLAVLASARTDGEHMRPVVDDNQAFRPSPSNAEAKVRVDLVGPYKIEVDGIEIRSGLRAKARELLAFYLLHPEGATLDEATEALWPEADPRRGSEWFWTALGNLRTRVRQATGRKELKVIDRDGDLYRVEDIFDVDLWRLERALYEGVHGGDDEARRAAFDEAAAAYTGELLAGVDWFWLETPREDLRERVVDVLVWLGDRRWASADVEGAAQALNQALEVDPFAEQVYRRVFRLQTRISRFDEVDGAYRALKARLAEIGLEPTAETQKLYSELRPSA